MPSSFDQAPQRALRLAGLCYLGIIALGLFGEAFVRGALVVAGDPAATARAIAAAPLLWQAGIVGDLLMHVLDVPVIVVMYLLLKPVSEPLALMATLINLVQTAVLAANKLTLLVPTYLLAPGAHRLAFTPEQLQALSSLAIKAHGYGFGVGLIFFGIGCLVRGYLIVQSGFLPRTLGVLMILAGLSYLINSFALLLAPALAAWLFPVVLVPAFVGELLFALWLVVKGVNLDQWRRRTGPKAALQPG